LVYSRTKRQAKSDKTAQIPHKMRRFETKAFAEREFYIIFAASIQSIKQILKDDME
jgi:hypothetical protein